MPNAAASRLVLAPFSEERVTATAHELLAEAGGHVSCAFVFASASYRAHLPDFLEILQVHGHVPMLAGCSGAGLIHTDTEAEETEGFTALFLHLPETEITPLALDGEKEETTAPPDFAIVLGDPATWPVEDRLRALNTAFPGVPCLGGLASATPDSNSFFVFRDHQLAEGAVALGFRGGVRLETVVSQGCRPIGEPFPITAAEGNVVAKLGARPAYERLTEMLATLPAGEKTRAPGNLFAGLAMTEYREEFTTGDFLVRNILGADPHSGAMAIGALPRVGQTLQFQLRDRHAAHEDLHHLLGAKTSHGVKPFAALLFSCNGRGKGLFGQPHHDAAAVSEHFGPVPLAGFFCNGEIGPVGRENFVHGYTASIALFTDI